MMKLKVVVLGILVLCCSIRGGSTKPGTAMNETLVWSDEFKDATKNSPPNPHNWSYDVGGGNNNELETYCAFGSNKPPCNASLPNSYVGTDGYLHLIARTNVKGNYTSARLNSRGLQSFQYGRIEAKIKIPDGKGMWPAFWMLGNKSNWPACGEMDIMETVGTKTNTNTGSIHGTGFTGEKLGVQISFRNKGLFSSDFHIYGMIWSPKKIQYYVDSPQNIYATFTPYTLPLGAAWPFDAGKFYLLLNLAVGGILPGSPNASTPFPVEMLVDYVRVYQTTPSK